MHEARRTGLAQWRCPLRAGSQYESLRSPEQDREGVGSRRGASGGSGGKPEPPGLVWGQTHFDLYFEGIEEPGRVLI